MQKLIFILMTATMTSFSAHADDGSLILSIAGVVNDQYKQSNSGNEDNEYNLGAGLLIEANINDHFGIETGALFIRRQYDVGGNNLRLVQSVNRLHIPVLARFWLSDYFSVGVGPFMALKTGDVKNTIEVGGNQIGTLNTAADEDLEYGLDAAATFNLALDDKTGIFVEGRYSTILSQGSDEKADEISALLGVKIDI